tara:strand:- start:6 stop:437 length:432 start_codon:yes stop_codon:yes gene_type:complete
MRKNLITKEEYLTNIKPSKPKNKYRNEIVRTEEGVFRSKAEHKRWEELKLLERAGEITHLDREVCIPLHVNDRLIGNYYADAVYSKTDSRAYIRLKDGHIAFFPNCVVEDTKGGEKRTDLFKWKASHFKAQYGFEISLNKAYL